MINPEPQPIVTGGLISRKVQSTEVSVFLFLILSSIGSSFFFISGQLHVHFVAVAVSSIFNDLALLGLVLYFIWRNGEPRQQIGWTRRRWPREVAWGILLFFPSVFVVSLLEHGLRSAGLSALTKLPSFLSASGVGGAILASVLVIVVAIVEETVFRGYLILRLQTVTGRTGAAVLLSSVIFSLGHGYEGTAGMISVFALGMIFAPVYLWRQSLVAPIVMHFLTDFTSIVLVAILKMNK